MADPLSRRAFLERSPAGLTAAWLAAHRIELAAAHQHAAHAAQSPQSTELEYLTRAQAAEVEAVAAQIIPADDTPGAREAGVVYFIDRALATFFKKDRPTYAKGLADLERRARRQSPGVARFSELAADRQIAILKALEKTPFFETVRLHTLIGFFANPEHGGNRERVGWKLIGFEDEVSFEPPFGYYDRRASERD